MKSRLSLLVVFTLILSGIFGQAVQSIEGEIRTMEDMGYRNESIRGIAGALNFFLKLNPKDDVNNMRLVLKVKPSQVLNKDLSAVTVSLRDEPVYTSRITSNGIDSIMTITIDLNKRFVQPDGRFIKLRVDARMCMTDEYCKDVDNPAVWMTVRNSTYLEVKKQEKITYFQSLKETILLYDKIATPVNSDLDDLVGGGVLFALLKQKEVLKELYTSNYSEADTMSNTIVTGVYSKLPNYLKPFLPDLKPGQGCIYNIQPWGDNRYVMVITGKDADGYKKAINTLTNYKILNASFSYRMVIENGPPNYFLANSLPVVFSLEDLGGTPKLMEGVGALKTNYSFSLADYNAIPKKLTFHLEAMLTLLKEEDRGYVNVYLNDNLVFSADLHDKTSFVGDVELKPYLLTKNNSLVVEFRFHPQGSICKSGFSNFYAFIDTKTSNLVFSGEKQNEFYNFFNYPGEFRKKPLKFIVSPSIMPHLASSMGELIYQLNTTTVQANHLNIPEMTTTEKATVADLKDYNAILLVHRNDPFVKNFTSDMPVQFNRDFQLYKNMSGQTTFSINDFSNSGVAQIFRYQASTIMMITSLQDTVISDAFEGVIKSFGSQYSAIESNVCFASSKGRSNFFFKVPENSGVVTYRGEKNYLAIFWNNYRYFILIAALLLVIGAFVFVRKRVKKSQENF
jgi:hypothetical protein